MISNKQSLSQNQTLQQRLSPQQIQYVKLLQLPLAELSQRIEEEMQINPVLEYADTSSPSDSVSNADSVANDEPQVADSNEINWEQIYPRDEFDAWKTGRHHRSDDHYEITRSYVESPLEKLEQQIELLDLSESQRLIAEQIIGSLDVDGYFRRELSSVADSIAFNHGIPVKEHEVFEVLYQIQQLDPPGIAARDLQECLLIQLENMPDGTKGRDDAIRILRTKWDLFEKKHFDKIALQLDLSEPHVADAYHCIQALDPKPGKSTDPITTNLAVKPDVIVVPIDDEMNRGDADARVGDIAIILTKENQPKMAISPYYLGLLQQMKTSKLSSKDQKQAEQFIKQNIESAQWFLDSLKMRGDTLLAVVTEIVRRQEPFFQTGGNMRPLIMKDIAEAANLDISTVSRIVNGKFVQTRHGTFELRSFFNEGIDTTDGDEVTNREVQAIVSDIINAENKRHPLSDQAITDELNSRGYPVARRTVAKYREALGIPVARLRKGFA